MSIYSDSFQKEILKNKNTSLYKIFHLIEPGTKNILDIGCSSGYFGKALMKKYNCQCYGIELDKNDSEIAKKVLTKVFQKDIDNTDITKIFSKTKFDGIILADILEHLKNPENLLKQLKKILNLKSHIYLSIPNVTHKSVLLELISNQWNYEESGILDKTHLRFFSYDSVLNLL